MKAQSLTSLNNPSESKDSSTQPYRASPIQGVSARLVTFSSHQDLSTAASIQSPSNSSAGSEARNLIRKENVLATGSAPSEQEYIVRAEPVFMTAIEPDGERLGEELKEVS